MADFTPVAPPEPPALLRELSGELPRRGPRRSGRLVTRRDPLETSADAFEAMHVGRAADATEAIRVVLAP